MQRFLVFSNNTFIFYTHLGYSLNFTVSFHCQVMGPIPPPSGGIVGKNWSTRSKIPVRSKRVGLPRVKWGPFTWIPQCYLLIRLYVLFTSLPQLFGITRLSQTQQWHENRLYMTKLIPDLRKEKLLIVLKHLYKIRPLVKYHHDRCSRI